jgi:hypothetical protein
MLLHSSAKTAGKTIELDKINFGKLILTIGMEKSFHLARSKLYLRDNLMKYGKEKRFMASIITRKITQ